jgi:hypothetical protein
MADYDAPDESDVSSLSVRPFRQGAEENVTRADDFPVSAHR